MLLISKSSVVNLFLKVESNFIADLIDFILSINFILLLNNSRISFLYLNKFSKFSKSIIFYFFMFSLTKHSFFINFIDLRKNFKPPSIVILIININYYYSFDLDSESIALVLIL